MKIISGGQTGVDQEALAVAKEHGITTGGFLPHSCITDEGPRRDLLDQYEMIECRATGYRARTRQNVEVSDVTIWFGIKSPGYYCTKRACLDYGKPFIENPTARQVAAILESDEIINIAGNRQRTHPMSAVQCRMILTEALKQRRGVNGSESRMKLKLTFVSSPVAAPYDVTLQRKNSITIEASFLREPTKEDVERIFNLERAFNELTTGRLHVSIEEK